MKILADLVIKGEERKAWEIVQRAIDEGLPLGRDFNERLTSGDEADWRVGQVATTR